MAWYDADPSRQIVDEELNQRMDKIITAWESTWD
jgi:hypothetical protein